MLAGAAEVGSFENPAFSIELETEGSVAASESSDLAILDGVDIGLLRAKKRVVS